MRQICTRCAIEPLESRRLLSVVAQDLNWGVAGKVISDLKGDNSGTRETVADAIIQSDGKPLVLAYNFATGNDTDGYLVRYNTDGTRDESFGPRGIISLPKQGITRYQRMHPLPDGKLLLAGMSSTYLVGNFYTKLMLVRLNSDFSLDTSFGNGGIAISMNEVRGTLPTFFATAVCPDGKILAGSQFGYGWDPAAIWRFNSDGSVDTAFGTNGVVKYDYGVYGQSFGAFLVNADGSFFVESPRGGAKFNADGTIDTPFGYPVFRLRQPDGKLLAYSRVNNPPNSDALVSRYNSDGIADVNFGVNGSTLVNFGQSDTATNLTLDATGRIILGATTRTDSDPYTYDDFALARLLPDGSLDTSFGTGGIYIDPFIYPEGQAPGQINDTLRLALPAPDGKIFAIGISNLPSTENTSLTNTSDNIAITRYVPDSPITISAGPFAPVNEGATFTASDGGSSYANGQIASFEWDYGSNGSLFIPDAVGQTVQLQAGNGPSALIELRVTTSDGLRAMGVFPITVLNLPPTADAGPDRRAVIGVPIQFSLREDDAVPEYGKFTVDYGDGTALGVFTLNFWQNPHIITPSHTYTKKGIYTLTVTYQDSAGASSTDTTTVRVGDIVANVFQDIDGQGTNNNNMDPPFPDRLVWIDLNNNGVQDPSEPSSVTDSSGDAIFDGLTPGTYTLRMQLPAGWQLSFQNSSFLGDYNTATITATVGAKVTFGLTQKAMITGTVFNDLNGNGIRDAGEAGISAAGDYRLSVQPPSGWVQTLPAGKGAYIVSAGIGQTVGNIDFGLRQVAGATAKGFVFEDIDGDGANGPSDLAYYPTNSPSPAPIYLDINNNGARELNEPVMFISSTDSTWTMPQLAAGTYTFRFIPRPGWVQTLPADNAGVMVMLAAGHVARNVPILPDGNYRAAFNTNLTKDLAGNPLTGQTDLSFFVLKGDLNGDRTVSIADFITLASNFGKTNATYADGDLKYDGTVTISDLIDLAANFNATLPAPSPAAPAQAAAAVETSSASSAPLADVLADNSNPKVVQAKPVLIISRHARHHRKPHYFSRG